VCATASVEVIDQPTARATRWSVAAIPGSGNPKFKQLSERLDALKDRFESGQINSVEFLKQLLVIAKETLQVEKETPPEQDEDRGKAALTQLFNEIKTPETPKPRTLLRNIGTAKGGRSAVICRKWP